MSKRPQGEEEKKDPTPGTPGGGEQSPNTNLAAYVTAATRIPTSFPLGSKTKDTNILNSEITYTKPIPGIMVLDYVPTLGVSTEPTSALNRSAFYEQNMIRQGISGNRPYEPADHMIYRVAVDSMRDLYAYVSRIYKVLATYNALNLYRPDAILKAMGLDAANWRAHAADLFQWLQNNVNALLPFPTVPIGSMTAKHYIYNSAFFTDGELSRSQTYIMNQKYFWSYEVVDQVKGLTPRAMGATYEEFIEMWNTMYSALQSSSDVYTIAADIRRVYQDRVVTSLTAPAAGDMVTYVKNDSMLLSIMNAAILDAGKLVDNTINTFRIYDESGILKCIPSVGGYLFDTAATVGYCPGMFSHINAISDAPDANELIACLRLKPAMSVGYIRDTGVVTASIRAMGTEVVIGAHMVIDPSADANDIKDFATVVAYKSAGTAGDVMEVLAHLSRFDWHPPVIAVVSANGNVLGYEGVYEDIQNYIPINSDQVAEIHDALLLNDFGLPG